MPKGGGGEGRAGDGGEVVSGGPFALYLDAPALRAPHAPNLPVDALVSDVVPDLRAGEHRAAARVLAFHRHHRAHLLVRREAAGALDEPPRPAHPAAPRTVNPRVRAHLHVLRDVAGAEDRPARRVADRGDVGAQRVVPCGRALQERGEADAVRLREWW